jgi:ATP-dependent exoDNAse (exonuclease V) alpha subunit
MTQQQALRIMLKGANVFLTGQPGSGKTYLLNEYIKLAKQRKRRVAVTATTGIAATYLNGVTVHSWAGIGIKDQLNSEEMLRLSSNKRLVNRYKYTDVLVIDEVSMLDPRRLGLIDKLAKQIRYSDKPIGGIQLILVGDLFQLPPVKQTKVPYIFNSNIWRELDLKICYLTEQHRQQQGDELHTILEAVRANRVGTVELDVLKSKVNSSSSGKRNVLRLYSHNYDADQVNNMRLRNLKTRQKVYKMFAAGSSQAVKTLKGSILSPEILELKIGCEVIFTANNYAAGYVNGDRGKVVDFMSNLPVIRLKRDSYIAAGLYNWRTEIDGQILAEVWQLPLRLAWAITIHKSQGMSLDEAEIDLSRVFSPGMGYVALSRLRNIDGLYLLGLNKMALYVDSNILHADKLLRAESDKLVLR